VDRIAVAVVGGATAVGLVEQYLLGVDVPNLLVSVPNQPVVVVKAGSTWPIR
jgi:hypothetical protein